MTWFKRTELVSLFLVALILCHWFNAVGGDTLLPPQHLTALSNYNASVPLFWFHPNSVQQELSFDDGGAEQGLFVSPEWRDNRAAVNFNMASYLPSCLTSVRIFLVNPGIFDSSLGDKNSPFQVSVNRDSAGKPGSAVWGPSLQMADPLAWDSQGQWLEIPVNMLIQGDTLIWIMVYWLDDSPTAPLMGASWSPDSYNTYLGQFNGEIMDWQLHAEGNLLIHPVILSNSATGNVSGAAPDSFIVYRIQDSAKSVSTYEKLVALSPQTYQYVDSPVNNGEGYYYAVTSVYQEMESVPAVSGMTTPKSGAELSLSRTDIEFSMYEDSSACDTILISNQGELPVELRIQTNLFDSVANLISDNSGYTWFSNQNSQEVQFNWVEIEEPANLKAAHPINDSSLGPFALNNPLPFYGQIFDSLRICSNGFISFTSPSSAWVNHTLPYSGGVFNSISPFWDDLISKSESKIYLAQPGDSVVISFIDFTDGPQTSSYSFQVVMESDGAASFQYRLMQGNTGSSTIGIQNGNGSDALLLAFNQPFVQDSLAVKIFPSWMKMSGLPSVLQPGQFESIVLEYNSKYLGLGEHSARLIFAGEDSAGLVSPVAVDITTLVDQKLPVGERESGNLPRNFALTQNYPNPFNQSTSISYYLNQSGPVQLVVFNLLGELVRELVDGYQSVGEHQIFWDGLNSQGMPVASGVYFYRIQTNNETKSRKMLLLK